MGLTLDEIDKKILNLIQSRFPIHPRPYDALAKELNSTEKEVWERINRLRSNRLIRRIGAIFDSSRLGFHSSLVGVKVNPIFIEEVAKKINKLPGITHHYQRQNDYNLWFTATLRDPKKIDLMIQKISGWNGVIDILNLPSLRTFKIKVDFQL